MADGLDAFMQQARKEIDAAFPIATPDDIRRAFNKAIRQTDKAVASPTAHATIESLKEVLVRFPVMSARRWKEYAMAAWLEAFPCGAPKTNPFFVFKNAYYKRVKAENPSASFADIMKRLGQMWAEHKAQLEESPVAEPSKPVGKPVIVRNTGDTMVKKRASVNTDVEPMTRRVTRSMISKK